MKAKSIHGNSPEAIQSALQKSMADGFTPTLAIVFISIKQDRRAVCDLLKANNIDIFGATSCGEFTDGYQGEGTTTILLLDIPHDAFAVLFEDINGKTIKEAGALLARGANQQFKNSSFILCSTGMSTKGEYFDGETLIRTVKDNLKSKDFFYGGMAGDDMTFTGSYVFTADRESDFGLAALVMDADRVAMQGMAITGWKPLGVARTVTRSKGSLLYSIDNKSAVEMYLHYLGKGNAQEDTSFDMLNDLSMQYPFIVERESGGTVLRTPLSINKEEGALQVDIEMPEGTKFWFAVPPEFDIVEEVTQSATEIKGDQQADALLVFSCAGRINVLGPLVNAENEGLHEVWEAPMAGFFTYGEYGRDNKNVQEFHSGACCWVALKEK